MASQTPGRYLCQSLSNFMVQGHSWKHDTQLIRNFLQKRNPKIQYRVHIRPTLCLILSQSHVKVRGCLWHSVNQPPANHPNPYRLPTTPYSIYSQLPSTSCSHLMKQISEDAPCQETSDPRTSTTKLWGKCNSDPYLSYISSTLNKNGEAHMIQDLWGLFETPFHMKGGTRWRSWLRHYATSRKVAGSSPDDGIFFFQFT
jgi:hypothetical protein